MRHRTSAVLALLGLAATVWAVDQVVVEDWATVKLGTTGVPPGWGTQSWGSPKYDLRVVENDTHSVLQLRSANEGSTITKDLKGKVNLKETPILEWSWKVVTLPKGGNSCKKATDDQAVQVYVVWPRFPEAVRSRIIGYVWDTTAPVGTTCKSEKIGTVVYVVLRSGAADLGKWVTERRDVVEDFRKIYGEEPDNPGGLALTTDSNDTNSTSEALVGRIVFTRR